MELLLERDGSQRNDRRLQMVGAGMANVVPAHASGHFILRSFSNRQVQEMEDRFRSIVKGAALMADVDYDTLKAFSLLCRKSSLTS